MKLTWIGTGNFGTFKNYQTNALAEFDNGSRLLIDCGGDVRHALHEAGYSYLDVNGVYISHLHADHIGGMEWLGFATYFDPRYHGRPNLYISEALQDDLWSRSLSGGMGSLQGQRCNLPTYFDVRPVEKNGSFAVQDTRFRLVQTIHFVNGFTFELSFGLLFDTAVGKVFITTDTQYAPNQISEFYNQAAVIFHDVECTPFKSGVHAHFDELCLLDEETKAKIWLVHYQDEVLNSAKWQEKAEAAGFKGFVKKGQTFEF